MAFQYIFEQKFLEYGWKPNWYEHPAASPLELVLIEPRDHRYLPRVLENVSCLVPHASLTILHSKENADTIANLVYPDGPNHVRTLPILPSNLTRDEYSTLLTSAELWKEFHAPKVLLFQLDSGIRYNNLLRFMQYDYVGAPWDWLVAGDPRICVGNGGFSLRATDWMCDIATNFQFDIKKDIAEDAFYARYLMNCEMVALPSKREASMFSVEHVPYADPMAFHQAYEFHDEALVEQWMATGLAPPEIQIILELQDAWIECENGMVFPSPQLLEWLKVGVSTDGLLLDAGTKLPCTSYDPFPGLRKYLKISFVKDGEPLIITIRLHRMTIEETVQI